MTIASRRSFTSAVSLVCGAAWLASTALPAFAQQALVPAQSQIAFVSTQMGVPVEGRFKTFDAQVAFDPKQPEAAKIAFTIDMASATLDIPETDAELAKPDWFDSKKYPKASFNSTSVKALGGGRFEVTGPLQIKAKTHDVVVPVSIAQSGAMTTATGSLKIKRLDYAIGDGDWKDTSMVADPVQIKFKLVLSGVPAL